MPTRCLVPQQPVLGWGREQHTVARHFVQVVNAGGPLLALSLGRGVADSDEPCKDLRYHDEQKRALAPVETVLSCIYHQFSKLRRIVNQ